MEHIFEYLAAVVDTSYNKFVSDDETGEKRNHGRFLKAIIDASKQQMES